MNHTYSGSDGSDGSSGSSGSDGGGMSINVKVVTHVLQYVYTRSHESYLNHVVLVVVVVIIVILT